MSIYQIIVDGIITNLEARKAWHQRDVICKNHIYATSEPTQKRNLHGLPTAYEMWTKLRTQYTLNAADIENNCLQKLYGFKYEEGNPKNQNIQILQMITLPYLIFRQRRDSQYQQLVSLYEQIEGDWTAHV